jgi:hypothetical protein
MFVYSSQDGVTRSSRDIIKELCGRFDDPTIGEVLNKAGYTKSLLVGEGSIAAIELHIKEGISGEEPQAIALVSLGGVIETYVTEDFHDLMMFMKEFAPLIESIIRADRLYDE